MHIFSYFLLIFNKYYLSTLYNCFRDILEIWQGLSERWENYVKDDIVCKIYNGYSVYLISE